MGYLPPDMPGGIGGGGGGGGGGGIVVCPKTQGRRYSGRVTEAADSLRAGEVNGRDQVGMVCRR